MTTRGFMEDEAREVGHLIARVIFGYKDQVVLTKVRNAVADLLAAHPLYPEL
jgi:glycine hydroxymethyltransferase